MNKLRISPDLALPTEAVTQTFSILAKRGVGKTYLAAVMVEEMLKLNLQVVVLDPVGVFWGLRAAADGKGPGLPIIVMGGDHSDVPLEAPAGEIVADFVIDEHQAVVLDLSLLRKGPMTRFVADFAERLYQRNRSPLHLILDEADAFAPQRPVKTKDGVPERCLGAVEDLVRRGRARGLGVTLVTQRSAVLNKDVLTQTEVLVALRTIAPQDRGAIDEWIKVHGTPTQREELMASLPSLPIGTAWFWSPGWLDIFRRVKVRRRETFDSSATPKVGEKLAQPKVLAPVDLEALKQRMAATIERAKAMDPRELQREIARLKAELTRKPAAVVAAPNVKEVRVDVPILKAAQIARLEKAIGTWDQATVRLVSVGQTMSEQAKALTAALVAARNGAKPPAPARTVAPPPVAPFRGSVLSPRASPSRTGPASDVRLGKAERLILSVLAQYPQGRTVTQVALLTGYAVEGGAFRNPLGKLRSAGYVEGGRGEVLRITASGARAIDGLWKPLPAPGPDLLAHWHRRLGHAEREILRVLVDVYPRSLTAAGIAARTQSSKGDPYEVEGGAFRNPLGRLRTLELIEGRGELRASPTLCTEEA